MLDNKRGVREGLAKDNEWCPLPDSNRGPTDYESGALTN